MTELASLGEGVLLRSLLPFLTRAGGDVLVGAGQDDAAAWREADGTVTVATCDAMVETVHFDRAWLEPEDIGWRAVALAAGDLAAKGASPTYGLASISIPSARWTLEEVEGIYRGMAAMASEIGLKLVGGDTTSAPELATIWLSLLGRAAAEVVPRSVAQAGWLVAVTGPLGAAAAGLRELTHGEPCPKQWEEALRRPRPRLALGARLAAAGLCCGDISDGLVRELDKFAEVAGTGCRLRYADVPLAAGVPPDLAIAGGEETELVCVGARDAIEAAAHEYGIVVVGELTAEDGVVVLDVDGREMDVPNRGYDHFA